MPDISVARFILNIIGFCFCMYLIINYEKILRRLEEIRKQRIMKQMHQGDDYIKWINEVTGAK